MRGATVSGVVLLTLIGGAAVAAEGEVRVERIAPPPEAVLVALTTIRLTFNQPVIGLIAGDLTVAGQPAKIMTGQGAGPYTFTGFAAPSQGVVAVSVGTGGARDRAGGSVSGASWVYRLVDPIGDEDGDELPNGLELESFGTDPLQADTDRDNIPDPAEVVSPCLNPSVHEGISTVLEDAIVPGDDDADDDGLTNVEEYLRGTDPCVSDRSPVEEDW